MRRLFIIRKDLNLHPGKLAAMVGHCAECYWISLLTNGDVRDNEATHEDSRPSKTVSVEIPKEI
jgi:peptidyl-tRNA hydrolase